MALSTQQHPSAPRPGDAEAGPGAPHVMDDALFRRVVRRERRRADRANQPFVLLVAALRDGRRPATVATWPAAIAAVAAAKRETDIAGWLERDVALGVILTDIRESDLARACEGLAARVRRQLAARFDEETMDGLTIRVHVGREAGGAGHGDPWPAESLLDRELGPYPTRRPLYDAAKRVMDVVGSLVLLVVLAPLFLLIALLVKSRSRGPVLFRQIRIGQMMKPFTMLKFRTMTVNADHALHHEFVSSFIKASGPVAAPGTNGVFKLTNDPRVTPIGRLLRKTSLDELPQLWNVLRGEMSLVGPRPPLAYELEQYKPWHRRRILEAKPGVTGLWQVAGRSRTTFDEMVRMDLRYVRRRSLWTDVRILLATPRAVLFGKGAC